MSEIRKRKQGNNPKDVKTKPDAEDKSKEKSTRRNEGKSPLCTFLIFGIMLIALSPAIYHQFNAFTFQHNTKPPGKLVGVSHYGQHMHFYCAGNISNDNYVVLLESGTSGSYLEWSLVQKSLLQRNIASCSFDKLGVGFSSALVSESPITSQIIAEEVKEALNYMGISKNIIYVGNFQSGVNALTYSNLNPESVVGLVLVDPIVPNWASLTWFSEFFSTVKQHLMIAKYLNLLGVTPFLPIPGTEHLPEPLKSEYIHFLTQYSATAAMEKELGALTSSLKYLQELPLNDVPIKLIHASHLATIQYTEEQKKEKFQAFINFAKLYTSGDVAPLDSDYQVQLAYPEAVARSIQEIVVQVKSK